MRLLLDTNVLLWTLAGSPKIQPVSQLILAPESEVFVSTASLWEITIKTGIGMIDKMGLMEVTWYTGQLKRIGRGEAPRPNESALWVFIKFIAAQAGLGRKKKPTKLRASA